MKNFLIGFLVAVVGCIMAFIALALWLYADYTERKKERKYSDHSDYVDYARYSDSKKKTAINEVHADHSVRIEST